MKTETAFRLIYNLVYPFNLFYPVKAIGKENIPEGPVLICPNHTTARDPLYIVYAFGKNCPMWAMAKQQVMKWPVVGWALAKAGVFGVDRGNADLKAAKTALRCLKENRKLLMFPEGTRVQEGESVDAKTGAALFATRSGAPLMPVYIHPGKLFQRATVVVGKPYHPQIAGRKATSEELQNIASDLMDRVRALGEGLE